VTDLNHMRNCEAREWLRRYKDKVNALGIYDARQWWRDAIADIEKKRGKSAADDLKERMNRIRDGHTDSQGTNLG
jgi:hypothetical protein